MKSYKVEFTQTETFIVDVQAENEEQAQELAHEEFQNDNYQEIGDCHCTISTVYDVTGTDNDTFARRCHLCGSVEENKYCTNETCAEYK